MSLQRVVQFPLEAETEDLDLRSHRHEPVECDVAGAAKGDQQFAKFPSDVSSNQGMIPENGDTREDRLPCRVRGCWILLAQELQQPFQLSDRLRRDDYLRHDLGHGAFSPRTSFSM